MSGFQDRGICAGVDVSAPAPAELSRADAASTGHGELTQPGHCLPLLHVQAEASPGF